MRRYVSVFFCMFALSRACSAKSEILVEWKFDSLSQWSGWSPNSGITGVVFDEDSVFFEAIGSDPQILSPLFDLKIAGNSQCIELDIQIDSNEPVAGQLFYTNKTAGVYGGLEPSLVVDFSLNPGKRHIERIWPFWASLGKIIRLRLDPPSDTEFRLYAVRIIEMPLERHLLRWDSREKGFWSSMYAAELEQQDNMLLVTALAPQAVIIAPVEPFGAEKDSILRLDLDCPDEDQIGFYWVSSEQGGLCGEPVFLENGSIRLDEPIDLRQFPLWKGRITHLAIGFGSKGGEELTLRSFSVGENDPNIPLVGLRYCGFGPLICRVNKPADLRITLENGKVSDLTQRAVRSSIDAGTVRLSWDIEGSIADRVAVPKISPGEKVEVCAGVIARETGKATITIKYNGQQFEQDLWVYPEVDTEKLIGDYVPEPQPVETDHEIGIYYFPGWSPDQYNRWEKQKDFPERDPLLGWYREGNPEVADWHIKWAVENGISFFIFDWYWRDGREDLTAGLNDGFLKARYCEKMKFAIMWANHRPFAGHTPEQLLGVTDYWIERYFKRPNYWRYNGKLYVSFFAPGELISCLGGEDNTRKALESVREKVRQAGLGDLHVAACGGLSKTQIESLKRAGFDSHTAYNYVGTTGSLSQSSYRSYQLGHRTIWESINKANVMPYVPLLTTNWDSRPWHGPGANRRFGRRTEYFKEGLQVLKAFLDRTGQKVALLEAWNEWGEGSYIEPNAEFGFKDIEAIREVFAKKGKWPVNIGPSDLGFQGKYDLRPPR